MAHHKLAEGIHASPPCGEARHDRGTAIIRCDKTPAWAALSGHYQAHGRTFDLREAFAPMTSTPARWSGGARIHADLSKNLLDTATLHCLHDLARECGVEAQRNAMSPVSR